MHFCKDLGSFWPWRASQCQLQLYEKLSENGMPDHKILWENEKIFDTPLGDSSINLWLHYEFPLPLSITLFCRWAPKLWNRIPWTNLIINREWEKWMHNRKIQQVKKQVLTDLGPVKWMERACFGFTRANLLTVDETERPCFPSWKDLFLRVWHPIFLNCTLFCCESHQHAIFRCSPNFF